MKTTNKKPIMTYLFLALNILVFLYMLVVYGTTTDARVLLLMGAKFNYLILVQGEWWRLITAAFIHIGLSHILFNGISLYFMGLELEPLLGSFKFSLVYLLAGLGGNLASFAFNPANISAGASTSIFGLFASFVALAYIYPQSTWIRQRARNFIMLIALNIINGLLIPDIDNWGHIGGAIFGFLVTVVLLRPQQATRKTHKSLAFLLLVGLSMLFLYLGYQSI
ncbi:rhomboid protease GluP [Ignavigranum ruoffiae]|uniref:Rhomboid protease GluP n=1 Tax=Ignavigranum ruoffiae TaxID=89093 RepID=A0A1H8ZQK7_9LACT|nr:rhomboid family intramembrane serine protease [Ignavigranum ruoffiae]SEP66730.1 rhomboid protease GluP [Ignavigranum ruoffiae]